MKVKLREFEEVYLTADKRVPTITYFRKETYVRYHIDQPVHLGDHPDIEEKITVAGYAYSSLWEQYGSGLMLTSHGQVERRTISPTGKTADLSKIPAELTELLKKLPVYARKVIGDDF